MGEVHSVTAEIPNAPQTPERPAWLPEQFKSPEELAQAYKALAPATTPQALSEDPSAPVTPPAPIQFDMSKYESEFSTKGELSEASYAELATRGFDKNIIDNYVAGRQATIKQQADELLAPVGGPDGYKSLTAWAASSLSPVEVENYNRAVASTDPAIVKTAILGLQARHRNSVGVDPNLVGGGVPAHAGPQPFNNYFEVSQAMADKRYGRDPVYTSQVEARVARSNI